MPGDAVERLLKPEPYARGAEPSRAEQVAKLPGLNDRYQAAGNPENHEVSRLVLVMGKDGFKVGNVAYIFIQYVHISRGEFGFTASGQFFRFVWADIQPKLVTVHGRNLLRICDYVSLRRMPWLRQADRDFRPVDGVEDAEPFIKLIDVQDWKRPRSQAAETAGGMEEHEEEEFA